MCELAKEEDNSMMTERTTEVRNDKDYIELLNDSLFFRNENDVNAARR